MKFIFSAVLAILLATNVSACPTSDDLDVGVVFKVGDPSAQQFDAVKRIGGGLYWQGQQSPMFPDQWQQFSHLGAFELYTQRMGGTGQKHTTYSAAIGDRSDIAAGLSFDTAAQWGDPAGAQVWTADLTISVDQHPDVVIGTCSYAALLITAEGPLTRPNGDTVPFSRKETYLPELHYRFRFDTPSNVFVAEPTNAVIDAADLRSFANNEQVLADILQRYDVTP